MRTFISLLRILTFSLIVTVPLRAATFYVAPDGADTSEGSLSKPFATLAKAQAAARAHAGKEAVTIYLRGGNHYLPETLVLTAADSGSKDHPVTYQAYQNEKPVISGGTLLKLAWKPYRDGILQADVPAGFVTDQLFVNGKLQPMARYPNFDPNERVFNGHAADAFSKERAERWADPAGGFIHAMHSHLWGDYHYLITGKKADGEVEYEGGWQNNRQMGMHGKFRFVENIFEELDSPGEWFLNTKTHTLYYYPAPGVDPAMATFEAVRLRHLVEFKGDEKSPVRHVNFSGITFRHAARTFMDNKEPLLRSDWTTYRGGALFFNGAEDCLLADCTLENIGGNTIFVNNYNRRITIRGCLIQNTSAGGISFIGDPNAVRSPLFEYNQVQNLEVIDLTPGPKSNNYPSDCLVEDCLITKTSQVEKQTAPIQIEMSQSITVRHCSIYDVPRAGINIGSGCWGGHVIEFCDVFDTVKETGDHGSFNSWGRDRFWRPNINETNAWLKKEPGLPLLDVVKPIIIRDSRWRCDHGWDIDLDDGSSNYIITNNLMLRGGLKLREGFQRVVENNIMVDNHLSPHVWYDECNDIFRRNIVFRDNYGEARMHKNPWGKEMDYNLVHADGKTESTPAKGLQKQSKRDENSIVADALFVDPQNGNFQVKEGSPALALGFKNFPMDRFGVQKASLKAIARTPNIGPAKAQTAKRDEAVRDWITAKVRNIIGQSEMSAYGTSGESGVLVLDIPAGSPLLAAGLMKDDVIVALDGKSVDQYADLARVTTGLKVGQQVSISFLRSQKEGAITLDITPALPLSTAPLVLQSADGSINLKATLAEVVGQGAKLQGDNIGSWKNAEETVRWRVEVKKPVTLKVTLTYSLANDSVGSEFDLLADGQTLTGKLSATGGWGNYQTLDLGVMTFNKPGVILFTVRPTRKPGEAVMNLRSIELKP